MLFGKTNKFKRAKTFLVFHGSNSGYLPLKLLNIRWWSHGKLCCYSWKLR